MIPTHYLFFSIYYELLRGYWDQRDSTSFKELALHRAALVWATESHKVSQAWPGVNPEYKASSKSWEVPGVAPKQKN